MRDPAAPPFLKKNMKITNKTLRAPTATPDQEDPWEALDGYFDYGYAEETSRFAAASYKSDDAAFRRDYAASGKNLRSNGLASFDDAGVFANKNARMAIFEHQPKGASYKILVVSFSGSDDAMDFAQDANNLKGLRKNFAGNLLDATDMVATFSGQTMFRNARELTGENLKSHYRQGGAKEVAGYAVASASAMVATALSPFVALYGLGYFKLSKTNGPEQHYKLLADGNQAAIDYIRQNSGKYPRIVIAGHSLGGNLANQFANELEGAVQKDPQSFEPNLLYKTHLNTVNTLYLTRKEPKAIHTAHVRMDKDLTDAVGPASGLLRPNPAFVIQLQPSASVRPETPYAANDLAIKHSDSQVNELSLDKLNNFQAKLAEYQKARSAPPSPSFGLAEKPSLGKSF